MPQPTPAAWRQKIGAVVLHPTTQLIILLIIVLNAVVLGLQTSHGIVARHGTLLHWLDMLALGIFIVELAAKFIALGRRFFRDGWNVFDFLVVAVALLPNAGAFSVVRSLRVLRVLRLMRFHARFAPLGFTIAAETLALCREMVAAGELQHLSAERIWAECEKARASPAPQAFFSGLQAVGALNVLGFDASDAQLSAMNARLQAVLAIEGSAERRLAIWLQGEDCAAARTALQTALPLPKRYRYWLQLVADYGDAIRRWHELDGETRWMLLKASGSLRAEGDILTLAQLMRVDDALYAEIRNARERVRALSLEALPAQYRGAELGEAIRRVQILCLNA